jgi:hypothetical protein
MSLSILLHYHELGFNHGAYLIKMQPISAWITLYSRSYQPPLAFRLSIHADYDNILIGLYKILLTLAICIDL